MQAQREEGTDRAWATVRSTASWNMEQLGEQQETGRL